MRGALRYVRVAYRDEARGALCGLGVLRETNTLYFLLSFILLGEMVCIVRGNSTKRVSMLSACTAISRRGSFPGCRKVPGWCRCSMRSLIFPLFPDDLESWFSCHYVSFNPRRCPSNVSTYPSADNSSPDPLPSALPSPAMSYASTSSAHAQTHRTLYRKCLLRRIPVDRVRAHLPSLP